MISASTMVRQHFLRAQIGARQEDHADGETVGQRPVAGRGDGVVEEAHGQIDMDAGAVARLAIGIDRAAVPHRLQRIDRRDDDAAAGLAIRRGDKADATGIGLKLRAVHADFGDTEAFSATTSANFRR
jgi:hypothetical protein